MKTVIEMAREVYGENTTWTETQLQRLERFAELVRADERVKLAGQPAQQEPVGSIILGGVIDTSDGPEYEEWEVEWNHKAIEAMQELLVTDNPVTLNIYTTPQPAQQEPGWIAIYLKDMA